MVNRVHARCFRVLSSIFKRLGQELMTGLLSGARYACYYFLCTALSSFAWKRRSSELSVDSGEELLVTESSMVMDAEGTIVMRNSVGVRVLELDLVPALVVPVDVEGMSGAEG